MPSKTTAGMVVMARSLMNSVRVEISFLASSMLFSWMRLYLLAQVPDNQELASHFPMELRCFVSLSAS